MKEAFIKTDENISCNFSLKHSVDWDFVSSFSHVVSTYLRVT